MELVALEPSAMHSYYFDRNSVDFDGLRKALETEGYDPDEAKPVPAFEIPEALRVNGLKFAIPDGNHRWLFALTLWKKVESALYGADERIDVEAHGLEPFKNAGKPDLYRKTIGVYCLQMGIMEKFHELFPKE